MATLGETLARLAGPTSAYSPLGSRSLPRTLPTAILPQTPQRVTVPTARPAPRPPGAGVVSGARPAGLARTAGTTAARTLQDTPILPATIDRETGGPTTLGGVGAPVSGLPGGITDLNQGQVPYDYLTAFAQGILPAGLTELFADPAAGAARLFDVNQWSPLTGLYPWAQRAAESAPILWLLSQGESLQGVAQYADYFGNYLQNQFTPGGAQYTPQQVWEFLTNPTGAIAGILNNPEFSTQDQVTNFISSAAAALAPTLPSPVLGAIMDQLRFAGDQFRQQQIFGQPGGPQDVPFIDLVNQLGIFPGT